MSEDGSNSAETPPDETTETMTEPTKQRSQGGCLRTIIIGSLVIFGMVVASAVTLALAGEYLFDRTVAAPVQALRRSIGIDATPVVVPDPVTVLQGVQDLAQLQTASFQMQNIVTATRGTDALFGVFEDSLIFVAVGEVTAGVDLAKLTATDIQVTSFQTATVRLPAAEVFISTLDNEQSYVADRDTGLLASTDPQMETQARRAGEEQILEAALEAGILDVADENARDVLEGLFKSLGFQAVVFIDGEMPAPVEFDPETPKGFIIDS